jgi:hypothetical protein
VGVSISGTPDTDVKHTIQAAQKRAEGNLELARTRYANQRCERYRLAVEVWRVLVERATKDARAERAGIMAPPVV